MPTLAALSALFPSTIVMRRCDLKKREYYHLLMIPRRRQDYYVHDSSKVKVSKKQIGLIFGDIRGGLGYMQFNERFLDEHPEYGANKFYRVSNRGDILARPQNSRFLERSELMKVIELVAELHKADSSGKYYQEILQRIREFGYFYPKGPRTGDPLPANIEKETAANIEKHPRLIAPVEPKPIASGADVIPATVGNFAVQMKILDPRLKDGTFPLPQYATDMAAGVDLRAMLETDVTLEPQQTLLVPTGIAIFLQNPFLCATVLPRSGLGFNHGIVLGNLTGLIDADYQGPLMVPIWNRSDRSYTIKVGERIAQMVFVPIVRTQFEVVDEFQATNRGQNGFGSTGTN